MLNSGRSSNLQNYLSAVLRSPILTNEQEVTLFKQFSLVSAKNSNTSGQVLQAIETLIKANLQCVVMMVKNDKGRGRDRGVPFLDIIDKGNLGLFRAIGRFDPVRRCRFSTYATWWIRQSIRRSLTKRDVSELLPPFLLELVGSWSNTEECKGSAAPRSRSGHRRSPAGAAPLPVLRARETGSPRSLRS